MSDVVMEIVQQMPREVALIEEMIITFYLR